MSGPPSAESPDRRRPRRSLVLLAVVLALGLLLRAWFLPAAARLGVESPGIESVEAALDGAESYRLTALPLSWYPQQVAIRLADRLHDAGTLQALKPLTAKNRVTRRGLHLARTFSVLYGLAGVVGLYLVARRLGSAEMALLAALVLCFSPWHIQGSVTFAPGIQLSVLMLLAVWTGLRAMDAPSLGRFAVVGLVLGLAAGVEPGGALVAVPVLAALAAAGRRDLRRALQPLVVAVPIAALVWWLATPATGPYLEALAVERASDARLAAQQSSSRFTVAVLGFLHPLLDSVHGRLLGTLALLGAAGQAFRLLFLVDPGPDRLQRLMVLGAGPLFILGHAWGTPLYRESAFVPVVAFSSLYLAILLESLWQGLAGWSPRFGRRRAAAAVILLTAVPVVGAGWRFVQANAVTSTLEAALAWLRQEIPADGPRLVMVEEAALGDRRERLAEAAQGLALQPVPLLSQVPGARLRRADGRVFPRERLEGPAAELYAEWGPGEERRRQFAGGTVWSRGPDLVAALHPYGAAPMEPVPLVVEERDSLGIVALPTIPQGRLFSLLIELPASVEESAEPPRAWLGKAPLSLASAGRVGKSALFVSERLPGRGRPPELSIQLPPSASARRPEAAVTLFLWP